MTNARSVVAPLPEAIDGKPWAISHEGNPRVDLQSHQMFVPMGSSPEDHFIRLHEMAHTKWTPRNKDPMKEARKIGVSWDVIQACEDMRMHELLFRTGFGPQLVGATSEKEQAIKLRRYLQQPDPLPIITLLAVCTKNTGDYRRLLDTLAKLDVHDPTVPPAELAQAVAIAKKANEIAEDTMRVMRATAPRSNPSKISFKGTLAAAEFLRDAIDAAPRDEESPPPGDDTPKSLEQRQEESAKNHRRVARSKRGTDEWGEASLAEIPLIVPVKRALAARRNRATDSGSVPRFMHRLLIDGQVFSRKKRMPGGTVLIDASGSMDLDVKDIDTLLEHAPCATVAMYSGYKTGGNITIIARNSHRAELDTIQRARVASGYQNIIDGPALEWLAKQPGPRIWVSDAQVTGMNEAMTLPLLQAALATARRASVTRLASVPRAVNAFAEIAAGRPVTGDPLVEKESAFAA